ncbi:MAG: hypothetical protein H0U74_16050 [Bradymonadaceae bacterium]|nr:hypothetical protein [Lujinxingiaceae bacterium]
MLRSTPKRVVSAALLSLFTVASLGCSSAPQSAERAPTERRVLQSANAAPTAEVLKDSPCGNPEWAKLPGDAGEEAVGSDYQAPEPTKTP